MINEFILKLFHEVKADLTEENSNLSINYSKKYLENDIWVYKDITEKDIFETAGLIIKKIKNLYPPKEFKVIHISDNATIYRRYSLDKVLGNKLLLSTDPTFSFFQYITLCLNTKMLLPILTSRPNIPEWITTDIPLIYDLSDNWFKGKSDPIVEKAFFIGTSAYTLSTMSQYRMKDAKCYPNGNINLLNRDNCTKLYKATWKNTVYIGQLYKLDFITIKKIIDTFPDTKIHIYPVLRLHEGLPYIEPKYINNIIFHKQVPQDKLNEELKQYDCGLILFKDIPNCVTGMLPLKVFNYINAGLPVCYNNCGELDYILTSLSLSEKEKVGDLNSNLENFITDAEEAFNKKYINNN